MNYLAHAWLSFNQQEVLVGNMISDYVKGKKRYDFDVTIQKGIMLHRSIDAFTDEHETTKAAKQFFKPLVGLYAGAFIDVAYDHFLACDINEFTDESLLNFSLHTYAVLEKYKAVFPEKFARMFPYMQADNWLYNYRNLSGAEKSFAGLTRRAKYLEHNPKVFECFLENYEAIKHYYTLFFPSLKSFAYQEFTAA